MRFLFLIFILVSQQLNAATYYVRSDGSDSNVGTANNAGGAWLTIGKAASTVVAGDIVRVQSGTYPERVAETTDGTVANRIIYIADGGTNYGWGAVVVRGFNITGDNVSVIGFEVTQPSAVGYPGIRVVGGTNVQILANYVHHTDVDGAGGGITYGDANYIIIRDNFIEYSGSRALPTSPNGAIAVYSANLNNKGILVEYNRIQHIDDFFNPGGGYHIYRNNVLGPTATNDFAGIVPHADGLQSDDGLTNSIMEANWHVDNPITDSHLWLTELSIVHHNTLYRNVSLRSGDFLHVNFSVGGSMLFVHNDLGQTGYGPNGGPSDYTIWTHASSTGNIAKNNIYTNTTTTTRVYLSDGGGVLTAERDIGMPNAVANSTSALNSDPKFENYAGGDLRPRSDSPAVDAATNLTVTTSSGTSSTTVTVANAFYFHDGFDVTQGHDIYVGTNNNCKITDIDYVTGVITLSAVISWANGDKVGYAYRGNGPDIGVYEYGDVLLTSASYTVNGNNYTATTIGDCRFIIFFQDGIPHTIDYTDPYTATISSGVVTVRAYAKHPQAVPMFVAGLTGTDLIPHRAKPGNNLRLRAR